MTIGLKLWSTNVGALAEEARRLFAERVYDYLELFVVPGSLDALAAWRRLRDEDGVPFVVHNAHSAQGFNLARREAEARNREIFAETRRFADALGATRIIFHGGTNGTVEEAARQLRALGEPRALVENKPLLPLPNSAGATVCRGATVEELARLVGAAGGGFCLDVGHAVCAANAQGLEPYAYVSDLAARFRPAMFHLSDVRDMSSPYDAHPHLGTGALDIPRLCRELFPSDAAVSVETERGPSPGLEDFRRDVDVLRRCAARRNVV